MDEALASALDRVLILSGGDPDRAAAALNERFAIHKGWGSTSTTSSTVSSPTTTTSSGGFSSPERIIPTPAQVRSPSVQVLLTPRQPKTASQRSGVGATPVTPSKTTPASKTVLAPPTLVAPVPAPAIYADYPPPVWPEEEYDFGDETIVCDQPTVHKHNSFHPDSNWAGPAVGLAAGAHVLNRLPPLLASITPQESTLSIEDFRSFQAAVSVNPFYLGEPRHIRLRNSSGSVTNRVMKAPPPGTPTSEKWYAIASGKEVGIFLSWLVAGGLVQGHDCNMHKSFKTESAAYIWLQAAILRGTAQLLN